LPRHLGSAYKSLRFYAAVQKPTKNRGSISKKLSLDPTDRLQREISTLLVHAFPCALLQQCWERGVFLALDPWPLDEAVLAKVYPSILCFPLPLRINKSLMSSKLLPPPNRSCGPSLSKPPPQIRPLLSFSSSILSLASLLPPLLYTHSLPDPPVFHMS
jgi:hypothetical protein